MTGDQMKFESGPIWKTFPVIDEDESPSEPLPFSETDDILLPEDYRPTKCEITIGLWS